MRVSSWDYFRPDPQNHRFPLRNRPKRVLKRKNVRLRRSKLIRSPGDRNLVFSFREVFSFGNKLIDMVASVEKAQEVLGKVQAAISRKGCAPPPSIQKILERGVRISVQN